MDGGEEEVEGYSPERQASEVAELAVVDITQAMSSLPGKYEKDSCKGIDSDETPQDGEKHRRE